MKTPFFFSVVGCLSLILAACKPQPPQTAAMDDEARRQLEETRAAYEKQAADMAARSDRLAADLAVLQQSVRDKESAELNAKLEAMREDNVRLQTEAEEVRRRSEEIRDQLESAKSAPVEVANTGEVEDVAWNDPSADYSVFYEELNPYGRWLDVEGYGYAWRPNLAERVTWRPYVDGRWAWSDQGWAWDSNEPFGWACYHYGRWVRIARHGWVWVPGREWAPAWVSWRSTEECVGWAPLPPGPRRRSGSIGHDCDTYFGLSPSSYTFIETRNFGRPSYLNVCLPLSNITSFFHSTVNVTNIVGVNFQQTGIFVNRGGPNRNWLERRLGGPLPRAEVQVVKNVDRSKFRRSSSARDGSVQLVVASIPASRSGRPTLPKAAERIARPAIIDAWSDVPADRRQNLRETVLRQARQPQPEISNTLPKPSNVPQAPVAQTAPAPSLPSTEERSNNSNRVPRRDRDHPRGNAAEMPQGGLAQESVPQAPQQQQAERVRRQQEEEIAAAREAAIAQQLQMQRQAGEDARERQRLDMQQRVLEKQKAEADVAQARDEARETQRQQMQQQKAAAEAMQQRQDAQSAIKEAAQQEEMRQRQTMAVEQAAQQATREAAANQQAEQMRHQQNEAMRRQQEEANVGAMRAQQEMFQRQSAQESLRQNALREQQQAQRAMQESAQRGSQEAAQRALQESARRAAEEAAH